MLAAQIELILLMTGLATAGALVVFLAPVTSLKWIYGPSPPDTSVFYLFGLYDFTSRDVWLDL